jgi:hypothetical protein
MLLGAIFISISYLALGLAVTHFTSASTLPLPLLRLTLLLFVLWENLRSLGDSPRVLSLKTRLYSRHQRAQVIQGGIATTPSLSLPSLSFNKLFSRMPHNKDE